jgi:tetratricopeptide (TPR) repeat protein
VTRGNFIAQSNYGVESLADGRINEAVQSFQSAVQINPFYASGLYNLGVAYRKQGLYEQAVGMLEKALAVAPNDARAEANLAMVLAARQRFTEAFPHYEAALRLAPQESEVLLSYSNALSNYGAQMGQSGRHQDAIRYFERALEILPANDSAKKNLEYERSRPAARGN